MKNLRVLLCLLTLLPLVSIAPGANTQTRPDAERDVEVTVATQEPDLVLGKVTNKSANAYPCIEIVVSLRELTSPKDLGTFTVYVQNLKAHEARDYNQRLPFPAIATKKAFGACVWENEDPANFPDIISFTASRPHIFRGESVTLEWRTYNTEKVLFNKRSPNAPAPGYNIGQLVEVSGSMKVRPLVTTKYYIEAKKGAFSIVSSVIVEVVPYRPDDE
jgi:hypothetical protein